jgi:DNA-binding NarL/FixJ family response regulator
MNPFMPALYQALIADDHPLFRNALRQVLSEQLSMQVSQSHNFAQTIDVLKNAPDLDLVFLDLNMPDTEGLSGLTRLRAEYPNLLVIIVSADENPVTISKCIHLGASAFIPKSVSLENISLAVNAVLEGEQWLPPDYVIPTAGSEEIASYQLLETLTPHQLKVLNMIANGLLNKQIAFELDISESTVKQHVSAVLRKLNLYNRTQAGIMYKQLMSID